VLFHSTHRFVRLAGGLALCFSGTAALAGQAQNDVDSESLLRRIRDKIGEHLAHLPSYTCHQVIDRLHKRINGGSFNRVDRVEVEVAFVGNRELFALPGDAKFEEQSISKVVPSGTIGNGAFGAHAEALFANEAAIFQYAGPCKKDGHKAIRYDFQVPQERSQFLLKHDGAQGIVGYKGSLWVDAETLDLVRMDLKVDHIPPYIGVVRVEESLHYKPVQIRDSEFLLPRNSEMAALDESGNYSLNMTSLESCREFTGESVVTYGAPTGTENREH
jgi:hypothetical protein